MGTVRAIRVLIYTEPTGEPPDLEAPGETELTSLIGPIAVLGLDYYFQAYLTTPEGGGAEPGLVTFNGDPVTHEGVEVTYTP